MSLHKVFHDILVCNNSREDTLTFVATLLRNNEKRAQIQVEERSLAGDGFMLNLLSIMQFLAIKVSDTDSTVVPLVLLVWRGG